MTPDGVGERLILKPTTASAHETTTEERSSKGLGTKPLGYQCPIASSTSLTLSRRLMQSRVELLALDGMPLL